MAYIVCDAVGLHKGAYSFAYAARCADGSTDLVKDTAERVVKCATRILDGLKTEPENQKEMERALHVGTERRGAVLDAAVTKSSREVGCRSES